MSSKADVGKLRQAHIDDSGLDTGLHAPRYGMQDTRKSRSPERTFLRRDMAVRRPVRVSRPGGNGPPPAGPRTENHAKPRRTGEGVVEGGGSDSGIDESYNSNNGVRAQQQAVAAAGSEQHTTGPAIDPLSRMATVPHYEVADGDSSVLLQEIEHTLALTGSHSRRTAHNKYGDLLDTDDHLDTDALRRHIDARRSYNTKKKTPAGIAILPNKSFTGKVQSVDNLDQCGIEDMTSARPPSAASSGLHLLDGKGGGSTRSSVVGPILDIEPAERMTGMLGERKKSNAHRGGGGSGNKVDPGISNSTHMLLQSKMNTQFFSFPNISAAEQRKAGCTPRTEGSRTHSRSPPRANRPRGKRTPGPAEKRPSEQPPVNMEPTAEPPTTRGAKTRYSRMIALGLPKVNIDIDRNHFSRQSLKRRSLQLRERYDIAAPNERGDTAAHLQGSPSVGSHQPPPSEDMQLESVLDPHTEQESTIVWSSILDDCASHNNTEPIARVSDVNKPHENTTSAVNGSSEVGSVRLDKRHAQRSNLSSSAKKEPVGVSYYKMGPPGLVEQPTTSPRFPRHSMDNQSAPTR